MYIESHKKTLGGLLIGFSLLHAFVILPVVVLLWIIGAISGAIFALSPNTTVAMIALFFPFIVFAYFLILVILSLVAGICLQSKKYGKRKWVIVIALICSCVSLLLIPIGTALGIYGIWVFSQNKKLSNSEPNPY